MSFAIPAIAFWSPQTKTQLVDQTLCKRVRQALHRYSLFESAAVWKQEFNALSSRELKQVVEEICQKEDSLEVINRLAQFVPLHKLEDAVRIDHPDFVNALQAATSALAEAKHYLDTQTQSYLTPTFKTLLSKVFRAMITCLESVINAFGIADFFKPKENAFDADLKSGKIMMLFGLFATLTPMLIPLIGAALVAEVVGGTLLAISALSLIYPYVRPAPTNLPEGQNWTELFCDGKLEAVEGRKTSLDAIAQTLIASKRVKTHPMLIGKSGVGKTEAVKAFVRAVERGDYPELKGKQIIYFNTATLVEHQELFGSGNRIIARISEEMGRHSENFILIFDEIHYALKDKENSAIGEQLKTMLDPGNCHFPYVIGITTEEEYYRDIYVKHAAFARRFKPIRIDNPEPHETLQILGNTILQQAPSSIVDPQALKYLLDQTGKIFKNDPQPLAAQKILMKCLREVGSHRSAFAPDIEKLRSKIGAILAQASILSPDQNGSLNASIQPFEDELRSLESKFELETQKIKKMCQDREQLSVAKKSAMQKVILLARSKINDLAASFLLLGFFKMPQMEAKIRKESESMGVSSVINRQLIDRMIKEEKQNVEKIGKAVARGRYDLALRGAAL